MNKRDAKKTFERYNRTSDVARCPRGRAAVRKMLDIYAKAAVNLYGAISRDEFVDIFNQQNVEQTTKDEVYMLLLPLVLKNRRYCFYKDYIVHYCFIDDFDQANYLLKCQEGKPRYIPEKNEFLKYVNENYEDNDYWWKVLSIMFEIFGYKNNTMQAYLDIRYCLTFGEELNVIFSILDEYNLKFKNEEEINEYLNLVALAENNARRWEDNGLTPAELHEFYRKNDDKITVLPYSERKRIGRNDPCPCGSGKKYKKCCGLLESVQNSYLSFDECELFYDIWYDLINFVNERENVVITKFRPDYPYSFDDLIKVRERLWEKPELIDEYISEIELPKEKIDILRLWRTNHKKGMFVVFEYKPEYAVVIAPNEQGEDRLYGIKGISEPVASVLQRPLPVIVETVLLPFKGKIIFDSFMAPYKVTFREEVRKAFREIYVNAIKYGIIVTLE